jgi:hypothetical protein
MQQNSDYAILRCSEFENVSYDLIDLSGREIFSNRAISNSETIIDLSNLSKGFYLLKLDNGTKTEKVFKIVR